MEIGGRIEVSVTNTYYRKIGNKLFRFDHLVDEFETIIHVYVDQDRMWVHRKTVKFDIPEETDYRSNPPF